MPPTRSQWTGVSKIGVGMRSIPKTSLVEARRLFEVARRDADVVDPASRAPRRVSRFALIGQVARSLASDSLWL